MNPILKDLIQTIKNGGVGVMPTDTMYGVVGHALDKKAVERIYKVRRRTPTKPLIILVSKLADLNKFGIKDYPKELLNDFWPGKISIILPCKNKKFEYLHRRTNKLAFRMPKDKWLVELLTKTGPLVAPSANLEGEKPSKNIKDAQKYFGPNVDFYLDRGSLPIVPSTIIEISGDKDVFEVNLVRKGAVKLKL